MKYLDEQDQEKKMQNGELKNLQSSSRTPRQEIWLMTMMIITPNVY